MPTPRLALAPKVKEELIEAAGNGLGWEHLADLAKISRTTLMAYLDRHPPFHSELKQAHARAVNGVLRAMITGDNSKMNWLRRCARSMDYRDLDKDQQAASTTELAVAALAGYLQQNQEAMNDSDDAGTHGDGATAGMDHEVSGVDEEGNQAPG